MTQDTEEIQYSTLLDRLDKLLLEAENITQRERELILDTLYLELEQCQI